MDIILSEKLFIEVEKHLGATQVERETDGSLPNSSQVRLILNVLQSGNETVRNALCRDSEYSENSFALLCAFKGYNPESMNFEGVEISDLIFEYLVGINASPDVILLVQKSGISEREIDILNSVANRTKTNFEEILKIYLENMDLLRDGDLNFSNETELPIKRLAACSKDEDTKKTLIRLISTGATTSKILIFEDIHSALFRGMITQRQYQALAQKIDKSELEICRAFNECFGV